MGWSQASYVLRNCEVPACVRWCIDHDPACCPSQQVLHPDSPAASDLATLELALEQPHRPILLQANVLEDWWRRVLLCEPAQIAVVSAPCPPWSRAGAEAGLDSPDGRLFLKQAELHGRLQTPVVVLEQVAGYQSHAHYHVVARAWRQAGYTIVCQGCLNLDQVLPVSRTRFLQVLRHESVPGKSGPSSFAWPKTAPLTLGSASALCELPVGVCSAPPPDASELAMYLDPRFAPPGVTDVASYRVKSGGDTASCVLAHYASAHKLPARLLASKGLFGTLVPGSAGPRFLNGLEVLVLHGAILPTLCLADPVVMYRQLGNCIAVPHALMGLWRGCLSLCPTDMPDAAVVLDAFHDIRLKADEALVLPHRWGWVITARKACQQGASLHSPGPGSGPATRAASSCQLEAPPPPTTPHPPRLTAPCAQGAPPLRLSGAPCHHAPLPCHDIPGSNMRLDATLSDQHLLRSDAPPCLSLRLAAPVQEMAGLPSSAGGGDRTMPLQCLNHVKAVPELHAGGSPAPSANEVELPYALDDRLVKRHCKATDLLPGTPAPRGRSGHHAPVTPHSLPTSKGPL